MRTPGAPLPPPQEGKAGFDVPPPRTPRGTPREQQPRRDGRRVTTTNRKRQPHAAAPPCTDAGLHQALAIESCAAKNGERKARREWKQERSDRERRAENEQSQRQIRDGRRHR